jgi:hypothetical protein
VSVEGHAATVADRVGMRYLARLLASPDRPVAALTLVADDGLAMPNGEAQDVLDRSAVTSLRARIAELRQQPVVTDDEEAELQVLARSSPAPWASAVTRAAAPRAARVSTGSVCCYRTTTA